MTSRIPSRSTAPPSAPAQTPAQVDLLRRAQALRLPGLLSHWDQVSTAPWVPELLRWEEEERGANSMQRRLARSKIGAFKPIADFDWTWPKVCDRGAVEELMSLQFMAEHANAILIGPNGIGKTTIARNIAYQALCAGRTVLFVTAADMLATLSTTNRAFSQWHEVFPNAACVVSMIDRLIHKADIIGIEGDSFRLKEAQERTARRKARRPGASS